MTHARGYWNLWRREIPMAPCLTHVSFTDGGRGPSSRGRDKLGEMPMIAAFHAILVASPAPCDILATHATPCVAAHSLVRALFSSYFGPLYEVNRSSDGMTRRIGVVKPGGVANSTAQDTFCAATSCTVGRIFDQTEHANDLTPAPGGGAPGSAWFPDKGVDASRAPTTLGGHMVYGAYFRGMPLDGNGRAFRIGEGYRNDNTTGVATGDAPETIYMVVDGRHYNSGCCFDCGFAVDRTQNCSSGASPCTCLLTRLEFDLALRPQTATPRRMLTTTGGPPWRRPIGARPTTFSRVMGPAWGRG